MTATDELRRKLDERGVEWWNETDPEPQNVTMARAGGQLIAYHENANGSIGYHVCNTHDLTPEQAVAATLGRDNAERYVGLRQGKYWERTENSDYYCGGCGWKVTDHDSYCPECGGALHKAALGSCNCSNGERTDGTCHDVAGMDDMFECSACGGRYEGWALKRWARYCPDCGRRIEVDE